MEEMREFMMRQEDEISRLKKINRLSNEDLSSLEGESVLGQRLYDIEMELSEQKRSTTKITKLCMAAINSLERIEEKPGRLIFFLYLSANHELSTVLLDYDESAKEENNVDPTVIKTLCQQMEALNKLLIKVDDDIEAVDQKAEEGLSEVEKLQGKLSTLEKSQKDKNDSLFGEMKAFLVSKTYATREDLSRSLKTMPLPLSKDEISRMIRDSQTEVIKTIRESQPATLKKEDVVQLIDKATSNFLKTVKGKISRIELSLILKIFICS